MSKAAAIADRIKLSGSAIQSTIEEYKGALEGNKEGIKMLNSWRKYE